MVNLAQKTTVIKQKMLTFSMRPYTTIFPIFKIPILQVHFLRTIEMKFYQFSKIIILCPAGHKLRVVN